MPEAGNGHIFPAKWLHRQVTDLLVFDPDLLGYASAQQGTVLWGRLGLFLPAHNANCSMSAFHGLTGQPGCEIITGRISPSHHRTR